MAKGKDEAARQCRQNVRTRESPPYQSSAGAEHSFSRPQCLVSVMEGR
jgi:hypothetical protein